MAAMCRLAVAAALLAAARAQHGRPGGGLGGLGGLDAGGLGGMASLLGDLMGGMQGGQGGGPGGRGGGGRGLCKTGEVAVPKEDNHKAFSANGCGPQGMRIDEEHGLFRCCNFHDICFSVCGTTHQWCEKQFEKCMRRVCKNPASGEKHACKEQAQTFSSMTQMFGMGFHSTSQQASCTCVNKDLAHLTHRSYLTSFLKDYNETAAEEENVSELLDKWKDKEGQLYAMLTKKYGHLFVSFQDIAPEFEGHSKDEL